MAILPRVRAGSSIARPPGLFVLACAALPAACGQPDASPPDAAAPDAGVDAPPLDAAADGMPPGARILITWTMLREGELLPCSEFHASAASHYMSVVRFEVPCDEHHVITDWLPLDTYDVDVMLFEPSSGATRLFFARPGVVLDEPGATVYVPLLFEVFDEPEDQLQAIFATARAYYLASPLPHAFPPPVTRTPASACCLRPDGICAPDLAAWAHPTWTALGFAVAERSRFHYELESSGTGAAATFTVRATADYDCDGVYRSHWITGTVDATGAVVGDDVVMSATAERDSPRAAGRGRRRRCAYDPEIRDLS